MPTAVGVNGSDVAATAGGAGGGPPRGRLALVKIDGLAQVGSSGPNRVKVTVPVGSGAAGSPVTVATSEIGLPMVTTGVAWVTMVATAWATTDVSLASLQALVTAG